METLMASVRRQSAGTMSPTLYEIISLVRDEVGKFDLLPFAVDLDLGLGRASP